MPTPLVVPDASVLLKWVLPSDEEPDADRALLLRTAIVEEAVRSLVPGVWLYEVADHPLLPLRECLIGINSVPAATIDNAMVRLNQQHCWLTYPSVAALRIGSAPAYSSAPHRPSQTRFPRSKPWNCDRHWRAVARRTIPHEHDLAVPCPRTA